jgi:hypothetical protein
MEAHHFSIHSHNSKILLGAPWYWLKGILALPKDDQLNWDEEIVLATQEHWTFVISTIGGHFFLLMFGIIMLKYQKGRIKIISHHNI